MSEEPQLTLTTLSIEVAKAHKRGEKIARIVCGELALRSVFAPLKIRNAFDRDYEGDARLMRDEDWAGYVGKLANVELHYDPTMPAEEWRVEMAK